MANYKCDACGQEAKNHLSMVVTIVGPKAPTKTKMVQFWLCEACSQAHSQVMEIGPNQKARVARRLTEFPEYLSRWKDWRTRVHPDYGEAQA
jgi:hypothetical protein